MWVNHTEIRCIGSLLMQEKCSVVSRENPIYGRIWVCFRGSSKHIRSRSRPHIPPQQTTGIHRLALLRTERYLAEPRAKQYANARACGSEPLSFVALLGDVPVA